MQVDVPRQEQADLFTIHRVPSTSSPSSITDASASTAHANLWNAVSTAFKDVQSNLIQERVSDYQAFLEEAMEASSTRDASFLIHEPMPTAIISGQTADTLLIIDRCLELAAQKETPLLYVRLSHRDSANIKILLKKICTQVPTTATNNSDVEYSRQRGISLEDVANLQSLKRWYDAKYKQIDHKPSILIILEDFEAFNFHVLNHLIVQMTHQSLALPFIFTFSIQTAATTLNELSFQAKSLLNIEQVSSQSSRELLELTIKELFIDGHLPITISADVYQLIVSILEDQGGNMSTLYSILKFICLQHSHALAERGINSQLVFGSIDADEQMDWSPLRKLDSYRSAIRSILEMDVNARSRPLLLSLTSDDELIKCIEQSRSDKKQIENQRVLASQILHLLENVIAQGSKKKSVPLNALLDGSLAQRANKQCSLLKKTSDEKFELIISGVSNLLQANQKGLDQAFRDLLEDLAGVQKRYQTLKQKWLKKNAHFINTNVYGAKARNDGDGGFTSLIDEVAGLLTETMGDAFSALTVLPFHELWLFEETLQLERGFFPSLLDDYGQSIKANYGKTAVAMAEAVQNSDLHKLYQTMSDSGKMINLYDWCEAYDVRTEHSSSQHVNGKLRTPSKSKPATPKKKKAKGAGRSTSNSSLAAARFVDGVGSLAWLGFLLPTSKKKEHVLRNVWCDVDPV